MSNHFFCGAARARITPPEHLIPRLYGLMGRRFAAVHDDLYLRVIALKAGESSALIVGFDLDKATRPVEFQAALAEATGIPVENILYFGIHTHTAPITGPRPGFEQPKDEDTAAATLEYEDFLKGQLLAAAKEALDSMVPARLGTGRGNSYINVNRNQTFRYRAPDGKIYPLMGLGANFEGPVDHSAFVMKIEDLEGKPIALFVNYAVHNVVMITNNFDGRGGVAIGGDIGGIVSQALETRYGGVAIWSSGPAGDVNPIMMNQYFYPDLVTGKSTAFPIQGDEAARAQLAVLVGRHFDDLSQVVDEIRCDTAPEAITGGVTWTKAPETEGEEPSPIRLQALALGDIALLGIGGELYTTLGWAMKEVSPFRETVILNHVSSLEKDAGYIFDDDALKRKEVKAPDLGGRGGPPGSQSKQKPGVAGPMLIAGEKKLLGIGE